MNKYLLEILKIENTVIIPGIGALMVTNNKTGTLMFNPHLKFNDKTLEKYVEQNSNMDAQESANFVSKYAREILSELDKGDAYTIFGLGKFVKNGDEIEFTFDNSSPKKEEKKTEVKAATPIKEEVKPTPTKEVKKEKPVEEKKEKVITPPINDPFKEKKTSSTNTFTENKKEVKSTTPQVKEEEVKKPIPTEKETIKEEEKTIVPPIAVATTEEKKDALEKAGMTPKKSMEKTQKDKKPKKKKGRVIWLVLLLLLIGSGVYIGINWDVYQNRLGLAHEEHSSDLKDEHSTDDKTDKKDTEPVESNESVVDDSIIESETDDSVNTENSHLNEVEGAIEPEVVEEKDVVEEAPVKVVESTESFESNGSSKGNGDYHVVVGLFSNPSNAEGLVAKLKAEGHDGMILGTFDNLQMVVVKSFPSRDGAIASMREIRSSIEDRAWVFRY